MSTNGENDRLSRLMVGLHEKLLSGELTHDHLEWWINQSSEGRHTIMTGTARPSAWTKDSDGNIRFTVTSDGKTGEQWFEHLIQRDVYFCVSSDTYLKRVEGAPTNGVPYSVIVRRALRVAQRDRTTSRICSVAKAKGWRELHWEVACLIRDKFSDDDLEQMGLWGIAVTHQPFLLGLQATDPHWLSVNRSGRGKQIDMTHCGPWRVWTRDYGLAFIQPEVLIKSG